MAENITLEAFETDWQRQWLVERGIEVISEASRHLTDDMKARHPEIPWQKVAGIGNVLRHKHENIAAPIIDENGGEAGVRAGVEFIDENGGGPGVRLRKLPNEAVRTGATLFCETNPFPPP